jgi:Inositol-pentakisphosphate 2-kinase
VVVGGLLAPYVAPGRVAAVPAPFRDALVDAACRDAARPARRRRRPRKDARRSSSSSSASSSDGSTSASSSDECDETAAALLMQTDCARIFSDPSSASSTLCVEVKPKAALTSVSRLVPPSICETLHKFSRSPYSIKNPPNPVSPLPRYSPADLLSCDPARTAAALDALRARRAHSLRVFRDGAVALADDLPIPPTLYPTRDAAYTAPENRRAIAAAATVLADQPEVVVGILDTQRRDYVDALGAEKIYAHLVRDCCGGDDAEAERAVWDAYFAEPGSDPELDAAVAAARARISYENSSEARALHNDARFHAAEAAVAIMSAPVAARVIADFMIASVVKDCSLMVSMTIRPPGYKAPPSESAVTLDDGAVCMYRVRVVDLEPKPLSKLRSWAARDRGFMADRVSAAAAGAAPLADTVEVEVEVKPAPASPAGQPVLVPVVCVGSAAANLAARRPRSASAAAPRSRASLTCEGLGLSSPGSMGSAAPCEV